jgi:beta-lactamase superfamily II metal-dependent hydrolase
MGEPLALDPTRLVADPNFATSFGPDDLVLFLANVGDGDAQLLLLPEDPTAGARRAIVVDAAIVDKIPNLVGALVDATLLPGQAGRPAPDSIALVVATHPHLDHIGGMPQLLTAWAEADPTKRGAISEFWDPGYFHTLAQYHDMMAAIEDQPRLLYAQPTSGFKRWISDVEITVLSPSIQLRNRFDSYGVQINDASISLRIEFPASRVLQLDGDRNYIGDASTRALVLGADAQTLSWSYLLTDFPQLADSTSAAAKALKAATGGDPLNADVLKVSHHASKHGVNLELVERIHPSVTVVSSVGKGGSYGFPHTVAQEVIREALQPIAGSRGNPVRKTDAELSFFYTADSDGTDALGSIAIVLGKGKTAIWRFCDSVAEAIDFSKARRWT